VYPELTPGRRNWWLIVEGNATDLCNVDPGFDVDLYVSTDLRTMTAIWMGVSTVEAELRSGRLDLIGDDRIKSTMQQWLGLSPFAKEKKRLTG
jgi:hypothetical protein